LEWPVLLSAKKNVTRICGAADIFREVSDYILRLSLEIVTAFGFRLRPKEGIVRRCGQIKFRSALLKSSSFLMGFPTFH